MFSLRNALAFFAFACGFLSANAMSVKDFEALPQPAQAEYVVSFLEKMTYQIGQQNPALAASIKDFYVRQQPGKTFSEGMEKLEIELAVIDQAARAGNADLSKIQIEGVVVGVTRQQFPPQIAQR